MVEKRLNFSSLIKATAACLKRFEHGGPTAGAVATSKGFGEKERAVENQWAKMHDAEKIKALKDLLHKQSETTKKLQEEIENIRREVSSK
ncbi:hypothetical protein K450DRAFT_257549 [Umbelopsis ramanniana AG]|uniref:ATPase inhibitor, mitochondrial n=1 Tax=Umbelopsis ramanniana AG TaxID=1314678 RepID=A0AAD5HB96_UMBRA|nr:uncharacterized protein K450DRAFT_257549 [Umbelopsis ramanniana AG]KAI8576286.1 hypothetical protein K450DRAFT_257549 [Umbelopsis ramanniana AG]